MPVGWMTIVVGVAMQVGQPAISETPNYPALPNAFNQYGHEGQFEQRYPFDTQQNWVHGYHQEIPAYGGHVFYRPYNYKDVLSQSQTAAGWGASPQLPYAQQFWHRYHDQATMLKLSRSTPAGQTHPAAPEYAQQRPGYPVYVGTPAPTTFGTQPMSYQSLPPQMQPQQTAVMIPPGYQLVPISPPQQAYSMEPAPGSYYGGAPVVPAAAQQGPANSGPPLFPQY